MTDSLFIDTDKTLDERLPAIFSFAPHLERICGIYGKDDLVRIKKGEAQAIVKEAKADFLANAPASRSEDELMAAIRHFRMRVSHAVAMTDLLNLNGVEEHMHWLSDTAATAIDTTSQWLCQQQSSGGAGKAGLNDGWFILALGKLGAGELNYSSDVDLIIITLPPQTNDDDNPNGDGHEHDNDHDDDNRVYINMTRQLVSILSKPTADGIGWRVDLRLRPDPGATPVAIKLGAAMSYYESIARTWERAAFIRARIIAGNREQGEAFVKEMEPFIWRRYLDYSVLDDMRVMLRREERTASCMGFNIKNGIGGIRAVEFFAHVQQLIIGGREKALRLTGTHAALAALAKHGWVAQDVSMRIITAYNEWRRLEHRLQMMNDAQIQQLPRSDSMMQTLAEFCGHADADSFRQALIALSEQTAKDTDLIDKIGAPSHGRSDGTGDGTSKSDGNSNSDGTGDSKSDDGILASWLQGQAVDTAPLAEHLADMGYAEPQNIIPVVDGWMAGRIAATRSNRTRETMQRLLPKLLRLFTDSDRPDSTFSHFANLLNQLPAGVQILSLLESNANLATTITTIFASVPKLASELTRHPEIVDSLIMQTLFWDTNYDWDERADTLEQALASTNSYEEQLDILRRQRREWEFQIATHLLTRIITPDEAAKAFSIIADTVIRAIIPKVAAHMKGLSGPIPKGSIAVIAFGRLGAQEMTMVSDLDLVFVYDCDEEDVLAENQVAPTQWYGRFAKQLINALTALTSEGRCYNVDMRLRPSGNSGPVAVNIESFDLYYQNDAWLWERIALLKARVVAGIEVDTIATRIHSVINSHISLSRERMIDETAKMRERTHKAAVAKSPHDLRAREGGLLDIDFLMGMLQLMPEASSIPVGLGIKQLLPILHELGLLSAKEADELRDAASIFNDIYQWFNLTEIDINDSDASLPKPFQDAFGVDSMTALHAMLEAKAQPIRAIIELRLGNQ